MQSQLCKRHGLKAFVRRVINCELRRHINHNPQLITRGGGPD